MGICQPQQCAVGEQDHGGKHGDRCAEADCPAGDVETFEIKYTFGTWPLQQYLIEFPDGRMQCLGIAWDSVASSEVSGPALPFR